MVDVVGRCRAGGAAATGDIGFKHGQHLAFAPLVDEAKDRSLPITGSGGTDFEKSRGEIKKVPLCNMFVSVANAMGVPTKKFSDSTGELTGLM